MALEAGTRLGHYEVVSSLGAGGMGEVYRAKDTKLGREVAIKLLLEEVSGDPERLARFEREARILASLNHSNIATLHGFETEDDTSFLVMELVEGETLAERIARGPMAIEDAVALFVQIAEGLEEAHEKGVIHRDLKPANVKVSSSGMVKILDFGLAKAMSPESETGDRSGSESPTLALTATMRGEILGTAAYMAPEQVRAMAVDKRADIWAFGVCLWEALTGRRLFQGDDPAIILASVLKDDPDLERDGRSLPPRLRVLLQRCLRKDPRQRWRDIGDVRVEITEIVATPDAASDAPRIARTRPAPAWLLVSVLAGLVFGGVGTWWATREPDPQAPVLRSFDKPPPGLRPSLGSTGVDLVLTPDGSTLAYSVSSEDQAGLYVRPLDRLEGEMRVEEVALTPFASPDSQWIGYLSVEDFALKKVAVAGGPPVQICRSGFINGATWGDDGTIVFSELGDGRLMRVSDGGGEPQPLLEGGGAAAYAYPHFLPGSEWLLYTEKPAGGDQNIAVLSLETGETRTLVRGATSAFYAATGHLVYGSLGSLFAVAFDPSRAEVSGRPLPVLEGVLSKTQGAHLVTLSRSGRLAYVPGAVGVAFARGASWLDSHSGATALPLPERDFVYARISPDGSKVAFDMRDRENDIWIWDLESESLSRMTFSPGSDQYPTWGPDGERLYFSSSRYFSSGMGTVTGTAIYSQAADGNGAPQKILDVGGGNPYSISPDGRWMVYRARSAERLDDLWILTLEGDPDPRPLVATPFIERNAEISPDGRWLTYQSNESGDFEIYVRPFPNVDDAVWPVSDAGGTKPFWHPDGGSLYYLAPGPAIVRVEVEEGVEFAAGSRDSLRGSEFYFGAQGRNMDIHPDGRFLVLDQSSKVGEPAGIVLVDGWFSELDRLVPRK